MTIYVIMRSYDYEQIEHVEVVSAHRKEEKASELCDEYNKEGDGSYWYIELEVEE